MNYLLVSFEALVIRDVRALSEPLAGRLIHYRDKEGLEVDAIVQLDDGRWCAFEVKLAGEKLIDQSAASLLRFTNIIDTNKAGAPAVLYEVVTSGYGYVRDDGAAVMPIRTVP